VRRVKEKATIHIEPFMQSTEPEEPSPGTDSAVGRAPYRRVSLGDLTPTVQRRTDGTILVRAARPLGAYPTRLTERLAHWARIAPDRALLAVRVDGRFVPLTYSAALRGARSLGQALLDRRLSADRPLAILSGNSREHLLLALAAQHVGVPFAPVSPAYSLVSSDFTTLRHVIARLSPGMVFVSDPGPFARALRAVIDPAIEVVTGSPALLDGRPTTPLDSLAATLPTEAVDVAHTAVGPDTVAKILFTSGSTGVPKGVINTHRMLTSNQQMILETLPVLGEEPPILVDWLPWHHTFGGNHNVGLTLNNGGTLYLDEGRPMPGAFEESVRNLREVAPTTNFNVTKGYEELVKALGRDRELAQTLFSRLRNLFYAAAALPQHVADTLQRIAVDTCGERVLLVTGLGATETAPMAICRPWKSPLASAIGLPVPGLEVKLVPAGERLEVRVRGPNVTPGYWREPELTREAFDDEGFYGMGDSVRLADPNDVAQGFLFDGRLNEDFKLSTGTWVHVGPLRAKVVAHFAPSVRDAVITGEGRDEVGMLAVPDVDGCRALARDLPPDAPLAAIVAHPAVRASLAERLASFATAATGSATRVVRAILLDEPLSLDAGELTDKGSVNQRAVLQRRVGLIRDLYADPLPSHVIAATESQGRTKV
jgi:feruloyl-CoA synthase